MRRAMLIAVASLQLCLAAHTHGGSEYRRNTFGARRLAPVAAGAAIPRGAGTFGRRLTTGFTTHVVKNSIEYAVAGVRHEDLHYHRSTRRGFGPRMRYALVSTVITRKTTSGRRTVASGKVSGAMGSGMVASAMGPAGFSAAGGAATGGISLGATAGMNVAREFWPRRKPHLH